MLTATTLDWRPSSASGLQAIIDNMDISNIGEMNIAVQAELGESDAESDSYSDYMSTSYEEEGSVIENYRVLKLTEIIFKCLLVCAGLCLYEIKFSIH